MLETVAPRPWARRMLAWHILETTGALEFQSGNIYDKITAFALLELAKQDEVMDCEKHYVAEAKKLSPTAEMTIGKREAGAPFSIPVETAVWLDQFDWESGTVKGSLKHAEFLVLESFQDIQPLYEDSWVELDLQDLRFELTFIEMLAPSAPAPSADLLSLNQTTSIRRAGGPGRRRKHDWDGAFIAMIARRGREPLVADPHAIGAQAEIVNQLADWFAAQGSEIPAHSLLQEKAGEILRTIRRLAD